MNKLYEFVEDENTTAEKISGGLLRTSNPMKNVHKLKLAGIEDII